MCQVFHSVGAFIAALVVVSFISQTSQNYLSQHLGVLNSKDQRYYEAILNHIQKEKRFDAMLLVKDQKYYDGNLEILYKYHNADIPKLLMAKHQELQYVQHFNSEILTVVILRDIDNCVLLSVAAKILNNMRHSRILLLALTYPPGNAQLGEEILAICEKYKKTNVILSIYDAGLINSTKSGDVYYMLKPYPFYHWQLRNLPTQDHQQNDFKLFPRHWLDMGNQTLLTYPDQFPPNSLVFADNQGQLQIAGNIGHLVKLFAQHFHAHLEMYQPLELGNTKHFKVIAKMVEAGLMDIPMSLNAGSLQSWQNMSDAIEVNELRVMVPLARQLTMGEVFADLLLNGYFFALILMGSLILSALHAFIDYLFEGIWHCLDSIINCHVLPGVLGQAFYAPLRLKYLQGLRIFYCFISLAGLYAATRFSSEVNSHLALPPHHQEIKTYQDLGHTSVKIILEPSDVALLHKWINKNRNIVSFAHSMEQFLSLRQNLNTSYGYFILTDIWNIYDRRQQYFQRKVFHTPPGLVLEQMLMWGINLQQNSPYKEPLNHLIHIVHDAGLLQAWQAQTYRDMCRLQQVPLHDPNPQKRSRILKVEDFLWLWILVACGWGLSCMVLLMELLLDVGLKKRKTKETRKMFLR
uniref:Ionotropic receptor n=1 Tax=Stomoxys calcitrans TaxID=35570 RepID=A0A2Y9D4M3_STOCA